MDLIDRKALLEDIERSIVFSVRNLNSPELRAVRKVIDRINAAPSINAVCEESEATED